MNELRYRRLHNDRLLRDAIMCNYIVINAAYTPSHELPSDVHSLILNVVRTFPLFAVSHIMGHDEFT